jgi:hypothetical protein
LSLPFFYDVSFGRNRWSGGVYGLFVLHTVYNPICRDIHVANFSDNIGKYVTSIPFRHSFFCEQEDKQEKCHE